MTVQPVEDALDPTSLSLSPPTLGSLCLWLQQPDHHCPGSRYWKQRRAKMTTLESAPAEVLHAICSLLGSKDVAAVRSTSSVLAKIGAHYLVTQVTFHTSRASLDRLQKIADHKVFSQYVETVRFEANLLLDFCCRTHWHERFENIATHGSVNLRFQKPIEPKSPTTVREKRLHARNMKKYEEDVDKAFDDHNKLRKAQMELHQQGPDLMAQVMHRFPRLQQVMFSIGRCQHMLSPRFQEDFDSGLGFCAPLSIDTAPTSAQLKHLLVPADKPLQNLRTLVVTDLDPSFFKSSGGPTISCHTFINLKKLELLFRRPDRLEPSTGLYEELKNGGLRDALAAATGLEDLRVSFNDYHYDGPFINLKNILGENSFDNLKKLSIGFVEAGAKKFIDVLRRQQALKHLTVYCVTIKGSWVHVLNNMKKDLTLKTATFDGLLIDDEQIYDMEHAEIDHYMDCYEEYSIGTAISAYMTDSFDDEESNPLESFFEEYADREALNEMWHEMMAETSEACKCDECVREREEEEDDSDDSDGSDDSDDDVPDLEEIEDSDPDVPPVSGTFGQD